MNKLLSILLFIVSISFQSKSQSENSGFRDSLQLQGQLSSLMNFNNSNDLPLLISGRYIPQLNYSIFLKDSRLIDFEYAANFYGDGQFDPFTDAEFSGKIKNYRAWARYSTQQFELRAGLQKINFGSATMLRPLMWFDQIDPRDPLGLTDGVWGILGRYYFLNNVNIWLWCLYGNKNPKGWELSSTSKNTIEIGGRIQLPVKIGEAALSFHHRKADVSQLAPEFSTYTDVPDYRIGFDTKLDYIIGFWLEGTWVTKDADLGMYTNEELLNLGMDYTFGLGNGLSATFEQLIMSYDEKPFVFKNTTTFSLLNLSYPIGLFDNLSAIIYYNWTDNSKYNYINWQKQFNRISLYVMAYWNPAVYDIPTQSADQNLYGGKGIQLMLVFNH